MHRKYLETTEWLFSQVTMFQNVGAGAYKPGLDTIRALCHALGDPQLKFETIHVGGTNGKGSTSSLIASVLTESGRRTGLFTSPHLVDFRERIRVNGEMIPEEAVVDFIDRYRRAGLDMEPSFFELTTAMAFDWFARCGCEVAVIEVGLGGRLDSTNIITPAVSVITNISLDHTALLGSTEVEIAGEKAGIIKTDVPVVIGRAEGDVRRVFAETARRVGTKAIFAQDSTAYSGTETDDNHIIYIGTRWGDIRCPLTGLCQPENANTALTALELLAGIEADAVRRGFENVTANTGLTGRWSVVRQCPEVICDTGHNPGGWQHLGPALQSIADRRRLLMVVGFVNDKDVGTILDMMPRRAHYYFATPSVKRGRPSDELCDEALRHGLDGEAYASVSEAYAAALAAADSDTTIFVGGSTFVVADFIANNLASGDV